MRSTINSYLNDYLKRGAETAFANRRGLRHERWSYRRVAETAFRFARELDARGISRGERVVLWAGNSAEWVAAFFGCTLRGAVVVPLDVESAPDFVSRVMRQTNTRLLLLSSETEKHCGGFDVPKLLLEELDEQDHSKRQSRSKDEMDRILKFGATVGTLATAIRQNGKRSPKHARAVPSRRASARAPARGPARLRSPRRWRAE